MHDVRHRRSRGCGRRNQKTKMKTKYHRDGSVTLWDIYQQCWTRIRASRVPAEILSSLSPEERKRIARMAGGAR